MSADADRRRGVEQIAAVVERHVALLEFIGAGASWSTRASAHWRPHQVSWRLPTSVEKAAARGSERLEEALTGVLWQYAHRLDRLDAESGDAALLWMSTMMTADHGGLVGLHGGLPDLVASARRRSRPRPCRFGGWHTEAQPVISGFRGARAAWTAEVRDAPHFLAAAGICTTGLSEYAETMDRLVEAASSALENAYMACVELVFKGTVDTEVSAFRRGQPWMTDPIGEWMQALVDGGINEDKRLAVLEQLKPIYGDAVAYARQNGSI